MAKWNFQLFVLDKMLNSWLDLNMSAQYGRLKDALLFNLKSYIPKHLPEIKVVDDLEMLIEDFFDSDFDMICEDDSPREVSCLIYKFENKSSIT